MVDLVSLDDARLQCRIAGSAWDEDDLLTGYIAAARRACGAITGFDLSPTAIVPISTDDAAVVKQAMLVIVSYWYENRDAADVPKQATWLLGTIRRRRL